MLTLISFIQYLRGKPSHGLSVRQEKGRGVIQIGRKEVELPLYADDMILYIGNTLALPFSGTGMKTDLFPSWKGYAQNPSS